MILVILVCVIFDNQCNVLTIGVNNPFMMGTKSPEAIICIELLVIHYLIFRLDNDQSVLENFHAATFFKILNFVDIIIVLFLLN